jgi:hypothetical protein
MEDLRHDSREQLYYLAVPCQSAPSGQTGPHYTDHRREINRVSGSRVDLRPPTVDGEEGVIRAHGLAREATMEGRIISR